MNDGINLYPHELPFALSSLWRCSAASNSMIGSFCCLYHRCSFLHNSSLFLFQFHPSPTNRLHCWYSHTYSSPGLDNPQNTITARTPVGRDMPLPCGLNVNPTACFWSSTAVCWSTNQTLWSLNNPDNTLRTLKSGGSKLTELTKYD
jgi:hypothetical protein